MRKLVAVLVSSAFLGACGAMQKSPLASQYEGSTRFTCCNIHYEGEGVSDANYFVGSTLPGGTPVDIVDVRKSSVTIAAGATKLRLEHQYGTAQESFEQYLNKVLVTADPKAKMARYSSSAQAAIREGRVERGMTGEQVLMSLGHPPTHRTASLDSSEWTYWYNRWVTYKVQFDTNGVVTNIVGRPAPTREETVQADAPLEKAVAPAKKSGKKSKKQ